MEAKTRELVQKIINNMAECQGIVDKEDVYQEGMIAYLSVSKNPNLNRANFSAYVNTYVKRHIENYLVKNRLPDGDNKIEIKNSDKIDEEPLERAFLKNTLNKLFKALSTKQQAVIKARYGLIDGVPKTHEEIGEQYGVSRQRIKQIELKALDKLRKVSSMDSLELADCLGQ